MSKPNTDHYPKIDRLISLLPSSSHGQVNVRGGHMGWGMSRSQRVMPTRLDPGT